MQFRTQGVLRDLDLTIHRGETVCVIGESGCGKTVLLKLIIGLLHPTQASVWFDGQEVSPPGREGADQAPAAVRVPVPDGRAVRQPDGLRQRRLRPPRAPSSAARRRFERSSSDRLQEVGLPAGLERKKPAELSGGQRKRVGLARALALDPEVMLYDEPTTGLDPIMSDVINELILQTQQAKKTTGVVVTHDMKTVTKVADRVVMLFPLARLGPDEPQIIYDGPPEGMDHDPDPRVRQFVRGEAGERLRELAQARSRQHLSPHPGNHPASPTKRSDEVDMNERVMQFRIGMFVIVAGLVLTMLIVWFGESPSLLRDQIYLKARYAEAPGVLEGVAVRKSGIRVGEVVAIAFDERPNQPDGVLVTMAIERKYSVREGSIPRLNRSLIGDVTIDLLPGTGKDNLHLGRTPAEAPIIDGDVAVDPGKALAAATTAFEQAGDTLKSINEAATGLAKLSKNADQLDGFLKTWTKTGQDLSGASQGISQFINSNETDFRTTMGNLQKVADKLNNTLTPETQESLKTGVAKISSAGHAAGLSARRHGPPDEGPRCSRQPYADHRLRPERAARQPHGGGPRAPDLGPAHAQGDAQRGGVAPEAAHPGRTLR